jgi:hypothetical protein
MRRGIFTPSSMEDRGAAIPTGEDVIEPRWGRRVVACGPWERTYSGRLSYYAYLTTMSTPFEVGDRFILLWLRKDYCTYRIGWAYFRQTKLSSWVVSRRDTALWIVSLWFRMASLPAWMSAWITSLSRVHRVGMFFSTPFGSEAS